MNTATFPSHASASTPLSTDVVVIGAGPVGLYQVFQLGLLDLRCHVIDALPQAGGQPVALYPNKPIFDIPGVPVCTGQELTQNLLRQVAPFAPVYHLGQTVQTVTPQPDGRFEVGTSSGTRLWARAVVIAAGVGAFQPRPLKADGLERMPARQLLYHPTEVGHLRGQNVLVVGGEDDAVRFALALSAHTDAGDTTLLHRRSTHTAEPATLDALRARLVEPGLEAVTGQVVRVHPDGDRWAVILAAPDGTEHERVVDALAVFLGLNPQLGPIAHWGLDMSRKQLAVNTATFSTSAPGIFAVGDINTYPGKRKLIACGFHECVLAAFGVHDHLHPNQPAPLLYTTSSPKLHKLLGVAPVVGP